MAVAGIVRNAQTVAGTRSTSGDGTAVIASSGVSGAKTHILDGSLKTATPGEVVTITLKHNQTELYSVSCTADVYGVATLPYMVADGTSAIYVNLSDAIDVDYTLTYAVTGA